MLTLSKALAQRLRRTTEILSNLVLSFAPGRIAKEFVELTENSGERANCFYVEHDLTEEVVSHLILAPRENLNKVLASFIQRGWIKLEPRVVLLLYLERLLKRAR